jgi:hypothetical protein
MRGGNRGRDDADGVARERLKQGVKPQEGIGGVRRECHQRGPHLAGHHSESGRRGECVVNDQLSYRGHKDSGDMI